MLNFVNKILKVCDIGTVVQFYVFGDYPPSLYLKHRPVYFSKHNVSETGFCLRLFYLKTGTEFSLRNVVF
jgi:hypothetical protein